MVSIMRPRAISISARRSIRPGLQVRRNFKAVNRLEAEMSDRMIPAVWETGKRKETRCSQPGGVQESTGS
jgi:hypothetical protein